MARYTGPKSKIARKFGEPIYGPDKALERRNYPSGQHGLARRRRKISEYGVQLKEKQKAKYNSIDKYNPYYKENSTIIANEIYLWFTGKTIPYPV